MIFRLLFGAMLATAMGQGVVITILPSLGREAGLSELQVAIIMSSSACIFAVGTTIWSKVAGKYGYRRVLLCGLAGYSVGTIIFASVWWSGLHGIISGGTLFLVLLVARALQSSVMSATPPATIGYAIAVSGITDRVKSISKVTSANNLGHVLGPAFAGLMVGAGLLAPLYSIVILTVAALLLVWMKLPETDRPVPPSQHPAATLTAGKLQSQTTLLIITSASVFCCMAMLQQSLGFFLIDHYEASPVEAARGVGLAMMLSAFCSLTVQFLIVQRVSVRGEILIQVALLLLVGAYFVVFVHQSKLFLYVAMVLLGTGMGIGYPSIAAVATSRCHPDRQATVTGMITATPAMGYIVGPPLAAVLYVQDDRFPFLAACLLLTALSGTVFFRFLPS